jgi:hypothetical protein
MSSAAIAARHAASFKGLSKVEFRRLFNEHQENSTNKVRGAKMVSEEIDLLFDLLDANGDGLLKPEEVSVSVMVSGFQLVR